MKNIHAFLVKRYEGARGGCSNTPRASQFETNL